MVSSSYSIALWGVLSYMWDWPNEGAQRVGWPQGQKHPSWWETTGCINPDTYEGHQGASSPGCPPTATLLQTSGQVRSKPGIILFYSLVLKTALCCSCCGQMDDIHWIFCTNTRQRSCFSVAVVMKRYTHNNMVTNHSCSVTVVAVGWPRVTGGENQKFKQC